MRKLTEKFQIPVFMDMNAVQINPQSRPRDSNYSEEGGSKFLQSVDTRTLWQSIRCPIPENVYENRTWLQLHEESKLSAGVGCDSDRAGWAPEKIWT
jgi:hypothetical protein